MADHSDLGFTPSNHGDLGFTPHAPESPASPAGAPSPIGQFLGTLGSDLWNLPGNIYSMARHPIDTALAASADQRAKAKESFAGGNYLDALTHGIGGIAPVPFLPPFLADTLTDLGSKENMGRGAARLAEIGAAPALAERAPKIARSGIAGVRAGGPDVFKGGLKTGVGAALAKSGPLGETGDLIAGMPIIYSGLKQVGTGLRSGWNAAKGAWEPTPLEPAVAPAPAVTPIAGGHFASGPVDPQLIPSVLGPGNIQGISDFIANRPLRPPSVEKGSPMPANAPSFKHPADYTDLIRQFHATHPRGTSLRDLSAKVFGTAPGAMPTYDQALALHEWMLRNPGKTPTPGLK